MERLSHYGYIVSFKDPHETDWFYKSADGWTHQRQFAKVYSTPAKCRYTAASISKHFPNFQIKIYKVCVNLISELNVDKLLDGRIVETELDTIKPPDFKCGH